MRFQNWSWNISTTSGRKLTNGVLALLIAGWGAALVAASWTMVRFEATAGPVQTAPSEWPLQTSLKPPSTAPAILAFLHPRCSCSEATIDELEKLLRKRSAVATVVITCPANCGPEWKTASIVNRAKSLPGVQLVFDPEGIESRRFGASTSGFIAAYSPGGKLLYAGDIAKARGVVGDNSGVRRLGEQIRAEQDQAAIHLAGGIQMPAQFQKITNSRFPKA
jgi:hypothetical protein